MKLISSQKFLNQEVVQEKIQNEDFEVQVSPVFNIDGTDYQVIMDGHHSYHAAIQSGNCPDFIEQNVMDNDNIQLLLDGNIEDFLLTVYVDSDYYDVSTGVSIF
jgi:hypothetical protein